MNASKLQRDDLHDSWVDVQDYGSGQNSPKKDLSLDPETSGLYMPLNIEKLLNDAQRESTNSSRESSARESPKAPNSPVTEVPCMTQDGQMDVIGTDWIWDWSSGPERNPSGDMTQKFRHPGRPAGPRFNTDSSIFTWKNIQQLLMSHAICFIVGAVSAVVFYRKYHVCSRI